MSLLITFFLLSVSISFLCSILESILLSINMSYVNVLEKENPSTGKLLKSHKKNINKSIASILILNTIANTLGAAAIGAQASIIFGSDAVIYISIVLTFAILFFSEIIPKTIGAIYWKSLAPSAAYIIRMFIWITYPIILLTLAATNRILKGNENQNRTTKEELLASMLMSEDDGIIDEKESDFIENILKLSTIKISDILTPRSVVFTLNKNMTIKDILEKEKDIFKFSRIPIYSESKDHIIGLVMSKEIFKQALSDDTVSIEFIMKKIFSINENIPVKKALDLFISKKDHMFLVEDKYHQAEGILTLEDCIETILGVEIVDESDSTSNMRDLAKMRTLIRKKNNQL